MLKSSNHSDIEDSQEETVKKPSKKRVIAPAKTGLDSPLLFVQPEDGVFKPLRNKAGLLNNVNYPLKSNGLIDWRKLIPREHIVLNKYNFDVQKTFTPIRVWGTVGFVFAMWTTDLTDWKSNTNQFVFASIAMIVTGLFCFT